MDSCEAEYSFHHTGTSNVLYVFEAPIDMLSYISLHKENWTEHSYVSLCSVSDRAVIQMLKDNPNLNKIYLCLDNDREGIDSDYRIRHNLNQIGYYDVAFIRPKYKDWNEILKAKNGIEPLPAVPHPTMNKMCELIKKTVHTAMRINPLQFYYKTICDDFQQLINASTNDDIMNRANRLAIDAIRMAKGYLLANDKELMIGIFQKYLPHTDKSCLENKFKKLNKDMDYFKDLFNPMQMRIDHDLERDIQCVFEIICDSLQIQSQIEMAETENFTEEQEGSDAVWEIQQA